MISSCTDPHLIKSREVVGIEVGSGKAFVRIFFATKSKKKESISYCTKESMA